MLEQKEKKSHISMALKPDMTKKKEVKPWVKKEAHLM